MANKAKRIGTEGENYAVAKAREYFGPNVDRAKTNNPGNDLNPFFPVPVEVRRRDRWDLQEWARRQKEKFGERWAIWLIPRDRRLKEAPPPLIVFPEDFALELLVSYFGATREGE